MNKRNLFFLLAIFFIVLQGCMKAGTKEDMEKLISKQEEGINPVVFSSQDISQRGKSYLSYIDDDTEYIKEWITNNVYIDGKITGRNVYKNGIAQWLVTLEDKLTKEIGISKISMLLDVPKESISTDIEGLFTYYDDKVELGSVSSLLFYYPIKENEYKDSQIEELFNTLNELYDVKINKQYSSYNIDDTMYTMLKITKENVEPVIEYLDSINKIKWKEISFYYDIDGLPIKNAGLVYGGNTNEFSDREPKLKELYGNEMLKLDDLFNSISVQYSHEEDSYSAFSYSNIYGVGEKYTKEEKVKDISEVLSIAAHKMENEEKKNSFYISSAEIVQSFYVTNEDIKEIVYHPFWIVTYYTQKEDPYNVNEYDIYKSYMTIDAYSGEIVKSEWDSKEELSWMK